MRKLFLVSVGVLLAAGASRGQWSATKLTELTPSGGAAGGPFGDVALSGGTAVVGAPFHDPGGLVDAGAAYVYERDHGGTGAWGEVVVLSASDGEVGDRFGVSVSAWGDTVVVGATHQDHAGASSGAAYVFERDFGGAGAWGEVVKLIASDAAPVNYFGGSVAAHGDTIVIGASGADHSGLFLAGAAYVFERDSGGPGAWGEVAKLIASDANSNDGFGQVALEGDRVAVGALRHFHSGWVEAGAAYVFERDAGGPDAWGEVAKLVAGNAADHDWFGEDVAVSGDVVLVGALARDVAGQFDAGAAYLFARDQGGAGAWGQVLELTSDTPGERDYFGATLALSGDTAAVGVPGDDSPGETDAGSVRWFDRDQGGPGSWGEALVVTAQVPGAGESFGGSVALCGVTLLALNASAPTGVVDVLALVDSSSAYCTPGTSASGCQASIGSVGEASASALSGFHLAATGVEGAKDGLFFFGANGRQANPWGSGTSYQCVVPPVSRAGLLAASGTAGLCDGFFAQDLNALWCPGCPRSAKNPGAGALVQAQLWYRDPLNTSNQTTSLSDAIEFLVDP